MELSGNPSPNRIRTIKNAAMIQTASSLHRSPVMELETPKDRKVSRNAMNPKREINKPTQVNEEIFERM